MAPAARSNVARLGRYAALGTVAVLFLATSVDAWSRYHRHRESAAPAKPAKVTHDYDPRLNPPREWPFQIPNSQYLPVAWSDIAGWNDDDQLTAFQAFRASCRPIIVPRKSRDPNATDSKALGTSLREPCLAAKAADVTDGARARTFFENNFVPLRISKLGETDGFVTGYYEPVFDGSLVKTDVYTVPVYRRPSNLFVRGYTQASPSLPNGGDVFRKIGRRKLVPYYDRAQIEDGAIAGRGLEIAWLKSETDLLFAQIQGSARIQLPYGHTLRINYDSHNGYRYTAVGRILIDRGIIPREQMSMQRIRQWMEENPDAANEVRRQNRSYAFFHEVQLSDKDEAVGAQGVPLTPGRSIAVDKALHVYGTPFFIEGELPIESDMSKTPFHRLMVAQDTGSAIVGPARADLYFGAGAEAGRVAGRMKNAARFVMLVPKSLDPSARGRNMPLPDPRPSEEIAKLFPQTLPKPDDAPKVDAAATDSKMPAKPDVSAVVKPAASAITSTTPLPAAKLAAAAVPIAPVATSPATPAVPLPEARPADAPKEMVEEKPPAKPAAAVAATAPATTSSATSSVPLPGARPADAPRIAEAKPEVKPEAKPDEKPEAKPKRAKSRRHLYRRAARPSQPQSFFHFPWQ